MLVVLVVVVAGDIGVCVNTPFRGGGGLSTFGDHLGVFYTRAGVSALKCVTSSFTKNCYKDGFCCFVRCCCWLIVQSVGEGCFLYTLGV